jgi:hypothetical protein
VSSTFQDNLGDTKMAEGLPLKACGYQDNKFKECRIKRCIAKAAKPALIATLPESAYPVRIAKKKMPISHGFNICKEICNHQTRVADTKSISVTILWIQFKKSQQIQVE